MTANKTGIDATARRLALLALALAASGLALAAFRAPGGGEARNGRRESAFERVMRTKTLRCAYLAVEPRIILDPKTGAKSGINVEIMEAAGKALNLKIDWVEEAGIGTFPEHLRSGKEDAFCMAVWTSAARAHSVLLTSPVMYVPLYAFVREDDTRFDNNLQALNDNNVTLAVIEGTTLESVAAMTFPKAKRIALPALSDGSDPLLALVGHKADAVIYNDYIVNRYNRNNSGKAIRRVAGAPPVRVYGESFSVAMGEWELREMLNTALAELQNNGTIESILAKYEPGYGAILRARDPHAAQGGH